MNEWRSPMPGVRLFVGAAAGDRYAVLRAALAASTRSEREAWQVERRRGTIPLVSGPSAPPFSLARVGGLMVVATSRSGRLGVDAETIPRVAAVTRPDDRWLSDAERRACRLEGPPGLAVRWTLKEALGKALGIGLPADSARWSFSFRTEIVATGVPGGARFAVRRAGNLLIALAWLHGAGAGAGADKRMLP